MQLKRTVFRQEKNERDKFLGKRLCYGFDNSVISRILPDLNSVLNLHSAVNFSFSTCSSLHIDDSHVNMTWGKYEKVVITCTCV